MSGSELRTIAIRLYGKRGWQKQLAVALDKDVSSVRRWVESNEVPKIVALAVQGLDARDVRKRQKPSAVSH